MKRYAYLLAAAALALNISCTGPENPAQPEATLKAEPASLRFAAAAAPAQTVTVTAEETEWTHSIPEDAGWLTATRDGDRLSVSVASGCAGFSGPVHDMFRTSAAAANKYAYRFIFSLF